MSQKLTRLSIEELVCSLIAAEESAGPQSDGAKILRAELNRRAEKDPRSVRRAVRLSVMAAAGWTPEKLTEMGAEKATVKTARRLQSNGTFVRVSRSGFNAFKQRAIDRAKN